MRSALASTLRHTPAILAPTVLGLGLAWVSPAPQPAQAASLSWEYTLDSWTDGVTGGQLGTDFELYGAAYAQDNDSLWFAIHGNLAYDGYDYAPAAGGGIHYGDLFLNFSGKSFTEAQADGSVIGIRFVEGNDSGAPALGVYGGVTAKSITSVNSGFQDLTAYRNQVNHLGGTPSLGALALGDGYLDMGKSLNVIDTYTTVLSQSVDDLLIFKNPSDFSGTGLDFGSFGATGAYTFGFKVKKEALPDDAQGNFIAHFFAECINDGMALLGMVNPTKVDSVQSVPEPTGLLGQLLGGAIVGGLVYVGSRRQRSA